MNAKLMRAYTRWQRRRWVRRCALAIVRHSAIGWEEAQATARELLDETPGLLREHPTDAAYVELGILEEHLI